MKLFRLFMNKQYKKELIKAEKEGYLSAMGIFEEQIKAESEKNKYLLEREQKKSRQLERTLRNLQNYVNEELGQEITDFRMIVYKTQNNIRIREMNQARQNQEMKSITDNALNTSNKLLKRMTKVAYKVNKKVNKVV